MCASAADYVPTPLRHSCSQCWESALCGLAACETCGATTDGGDASEATDSISCHYEKWAVNWVGEDHNYTMAYCGRESGHGGAHGAWRD